MSRHYCWTLDSVCYLGHYEHLRLERLVLVVFKRMVDCIITVICDKKYQPQRKPSQAVILSGHDVLP